MASAAASHRGDVGPGWIATALGVVVLVAGGFLAGLLVGIVSQEPELVAGHLAGRSEVVDWAPEELEPLAASQPVSPTVSGGDELSGDQEMRFSEGRSGEGVAYRELPAASATSASRRLPPVAAPPPAAAAASGAYAVQVGAFAEGKAADSLASSLSSKGFPAYVTPSAGEAVQRWRVRVGPIATRQEAESIASRLKADERLPTWVLSQNDN